MLYLDSLDDKPQVLYINSPGGEISPALGIYDTMASLKSQVGTLAFGHAWSIAAFLLAAGAKVSLFLDCARVNLPILYLFRLLFCLSYDVPRRALPTLLSCFRLLGEAFVVNLRTMHQQSAIHFAFTQMRCALRNLQKLRISKIHRSKSCTWIVLPPLRRPHLFFPLVVQLLVKPSSQH